jgi:hypothetical protein
MRCKANIPFVVLFAWLVTVSVYGQSFQGGLRGAARDTTGGALPGVSLTLTNEATGVARTSTTNEVGEYAFAAVTPGDYTIVATLQGFKSFERKNITIGTQQFLTLDFTMETGNLTEQVVVTAGAPLVETSNASTGEVLSKTVLETLPSQNRNAFLMSVSVPTVVASGDAAYNRMQDQGGASAVSLGGGAVRANNYLLDGVSFAALDNRPAMFPGIESLQELKVQVHTYDAEMGRTGGGVFNATARSGSNDWHGSGFVQNRPVWGITNGFFAERAGLPKSEDTKYWLGGGSLGGPITKSRTFFWLSTEDYLDQRATSGLLIFPTDRERRGDFSQTLDRNGNLVVLYDPLTTRPNPNGSGFIRDPFPSNVIPRNRLSQAGLAIANLFPRPDVDRSGASGQANFVRTALLRSKGYQGSTKLEHKFTDRVSLTGLYSYQKTSEPDSMYWDVNQFADSRNFTSLRPVHLVALNNTILASETTAITLRYGYYHFEENNTAPSAGTDLASLGFPAAFVKSVVSSKMPSGLVDGMGEIGGGLFNRSFGDPATALRTWTSSSVNGTVSKFVGRHTLKLGADYRKIGLDALLSGQTSGDFFFDRQYTQGPNPLVAASNAGSGLADLLLGYPTADPASASTIPVATPLNVFVRYYAGYAQDDFRATSRLTLNYGLRYEYETGVHEQQDRFTVAFDRNITSPLAALTGVNLKGGLRYAGQDGFPIYQGDPSTKKFAPRLGAAWSLNTTTVLRAGYGVFWAPWNYQSPSTVNYGQIGYTAVTPYNFGTSLIPRTTANGVGGLDDPFPGGAAQPVGNTLGLLTGVGTNIDFIDQNRQSPRIQQWSVDLQRELPDGRTAVTIGYMGARGDHLGLGGSSDGLVNINQLDPQYLALGTALQDQVPNPFFGVAQAGPFSQSPTIARGQLLRPFPQFGNVIARQVSAGRSMYHALVLELNRRVAKGIGGRVSYTWSRLKDNQFGQGNFWSRLNSGALPENSYDLDAEYAYSLLDLPHRLVFAPFAELPFGSGKPWLTRGIGSALLGGWTLAALGTLESGFPLNVTQQNNNTGSLGGTQRPNLTATDPNTSGDTRQRLDNYIDPAAYAGAAPFTFGNAPRTDPRIRTPFRSNWDITIAKRVPISGRFSGQLRVEMLNAFNQLRFASGPEARVGNPSFGRITAQGGLTRQTQLTFRLAW